MWFPLGIALGRGGHRVRCDPLFALTLFAALALHRNPPSNAERIDPKTLHLSGEFTEPNLGTRVEPNGQITARIVATQFAFVPNCVVLPEGQPV